LAGKTYNNELSEKEVSLGIERVLVAPYPTTWTPARIDLPTMPTSFIDLGAVVEDSPVMTITREKYQIATGLPQILQYEAVTRVTGEFTFALHSHSNQKVKWALGNTDPVKTLATTPWSVVSTPTPTSYVVTIEASPSVDFYVNDVLATDTESLIKTTDNVAVICSINGLELHFYVGVAFLYSWISSYTYCRS